VAGPIRISILANASQAKKEVGGLGSTFKKTLGIAGAALGGAAIVGGIKSIVSAASDAQQSLGGTQAVFGKYADKVVKDSDRAASAFGLSANQYRESANLIGSLLKNQGVAQDRLAGTTKTLVKTGADLAATYGGPASDAVEALGSAFKGEFDPLQRYGITLKQSTVDAEAMRVAHVKSTSAFNALSTAQQQSAQRQATQNLIAKQSTDAQGQFAKQTNTLAEQQQILGAKFDNIKTKVGTFLLPILTKAFSYVSDTALPAAQDLASSLSDKLAPGVDTVHDAFDKVQPLIETVVGFIKKNPKTVATFAIVLGVLAAAIGINTLAMAAFDAVLAINPITLCVIAIAALAAGMVYAYQHSKTFASIVDTAFSVVKTGISLAWKVIKPIFELWILEIKAVAAIFRWLWNNVVQPVLTFIIKGIGILMGIWAKMLSALGHVPGFGWAKDAANAMQDAANKANGIAEALHKIPKTTTADVIVNVVKNIGGVIHGTGGHVATDPGMTSKLLLSGSNATVVQKSVNITVNAPVGSDPYTIGEQIHGYLQTYLVAS
jgi:hypothetical protein